MSGFQITEGDNSLTLKAESFTLVFDKDHVGISSYRYETDGTWHEGVEASTVPPTLFHPYFTSSSVEGGVLYPSGGTTLDLLIENEWFVEIAQAGYLRNESLSESTDFPIEVTWRVWPSGLIACRILSENQSGDTVTLTEEAYRLNPSDDPDIELDRDGAPYLEWFGYYSGNAGTGENDLSHDCVVVPWDDVFDTYGESGNTNRIYRESVDWLNDTDLTREFLVSFAVAGSWGDCATALDFQKRGDALSADYTNPDPLDGSPDCGEVIHGSEGSFDEELAAYKVTAQ